ncbi:chorion peroxidase-like [Macrosteles quadrilineatus]|uniref:chorion peroxidase-like n=1 Tax=Macrosteles quadrilineatus TaxID=74068 RepID=UPI0023E12D60|nr:chorion peroxidase-like [Macrosteles quadrilineatus]
MNHEGDPFRLASLYSVSPGPRTTTTAQEFFSNRKANGKQQFLSQIQQDVGDACIRVTPCNKNAKFRTIDGSCNNLAFPQWGLSGATLVRIFPAFYSDGKHSLRTSGSVSLPSTRSLLSNVLSSSSVPDPIATYAVMTWGQLVSHDTARVLDQQPDFNVAQCLCCSSDHKPLPSVIMPENCIPISVTANDRFYSRFKVSCLNFMRSMITDDKNCIITPSQFISDVTHYVDASFLYGSTDRVASRLRTFSGGLLRSQIVNGAEYLPELAQRGRNCPHSSVCYDTGDDRVNQNPQLAVVQVMFCRLHNHIARQLQSLNPHWSDETLYQEARKIVSAITQRITYTEYLPMIISPTEMKSQKLSGPGLVLDQYDKFLNPGTLVSFTSAAFRAFHTMIPPDVQLFDERRKRIKTFRLSDVFFKPDLIQEDNAFENFVRGLMFQPAQKMNQGFTKEVTELLFKTKEGVGVDLVASDVMRGRDHGLPPYNMARLACGLSTFTSFRDLRQHMSSKAAKFLRRIYITVDDIDLYVGAILENVVPGAIVGPLLQCIISEQFRRWKDGDRFFYTFQNNPGAFTSAQLVEVEKMSLSKVACLVTDVLSMQPEAFKQPNSRSNKITLCGDLEQMDFSPWIDSNR